MAAHKNKSKINLLPQNEFEASTVGRILKWGLSTFRIIVILTEFLVMAAFMSRFWLDVRNVDLNDTIKQKSAVLATTADFEKDFRDAQKRVKIFTDLTSDKTKVTSLISFVSSYLPQEVRLSAITYSPSDLQVKGTSITEIGIAQYMTNLQKSGKVEKVTLQGLDLGKNEGGALNFSLKIIMKGGS